MTADVELLPLPKYPVDGAGDEDSYNTGWNDCLAECRACVAHATAAKDAEIEALLAEVEGLRRHGALLSNIAYNLAQDDRLPDGMRWSLDDARKRWDSLHTTAAQENDDA